MDFDEFTATRGRIGQMMGELGNRNAGSIPAHVTTLSRKYLGPLHLSVNKLGHKARSIPEELFSNLFRRPTHAAGCSCSLRRQR